MRRAYPCSLILNINSFGASVAQERREKVRRDRETNNGRLERTKTLAMLREFSTNKGRLERTKTLTMLREFSTNKGL